MTIAIAILCTVVVCLGLIRGRARWLVCTSLALALLAALSGQFGHAVAAAVSVIAAATLWLHGWYSERQHIDAHGDDQDQ